jgi:hypothetical protein
MTMDPLQKPLALLPHRSQVAFAAACVERVLPVYALTFSGAVVKPGPQMAVTAAWQFAEGGAIPAERVKAIVVAVDNAYPPTDMHGGPDSAVCSAALWLVKSIQDDSGKSAANVAVNECYALQLLDGEGQIEEALWQQRLLELLQSAGSASVSREQLQPVIAEPSQWRDRFDSE